MTEEQLKKIERDDATAVLVAELREENRKLEARVKGALELAADIIAQRDEFVQTKKHYDILRAENDRLEHEVFRLNGVAQNSAAALHAAQSTIAHLKQTIAALRQEVEDAERKASIAQARYAPMVKENEHHRRERDVLETQLLLLRDKAIHYVAQLPAMHSDPSEDEAMRSDIQRELYAMATPRKS